MSELRYPYDEHPTPGTTVEIAPGVHWLTMPMGGSLTHINLYLLRDNDGWFVVDTGLSDERTRGLWQTIFDTQLDGLPVKGVICTHMHPDHTGNAGFICDQHRADLYMTRAEYYQARTFSQSSGSHHSSWQSEIFYKQAGMSDEYLEQLRKMWESRGKDGFTMQEMPAGYRRLEDGDTLTIGDHDWQIIVGEGHSPEHACLHCQALGIMLSGDQILPIITSNVSVQPTEPQANPMKAWMESHDKFLKRVPADTLVLPAHNLPFYGARERLRELINHHDDRMLAIEEACVEPKTAKDLLPVLFKRKLDPRQMMMALGEAIAHIHLLMHRDRLDRELGEDGVYYFRSIDPTLARRAHPGTHDEPEDGPIMV